MTAVLWIVGLLVVAWLWSSLLVGMAASDYREKLGCPPLTIREWLTFANWGRG